MNAKEAADKSIVVLLIVVTSFFFYHLGVHNATDSVPNTLKEHNEICKAIASNTQETK